MQLAASTHFVKVKNMRLNSALNKAKLYFDANLLYFHCLNADFYTILADAQIYIASLASKYPGRNLKHCL